MAKKILLLLCNTLLCAALFGQGKPSWVSELGREMDYPREAYLTGFAVNAGKNTADFADALKASAKTELVEGIRTSVQSAKTNVASERHGSFSEDYSSVTSTFADAEIAGLRVAYYYDVKAQMGYAFAHAKKSEVIGYYKASIAMLIGQVEGLLKTAEDLEQNNEKSKASQQSEDAVALLAKVRYAQDLLTALDAADSESLQQAKSEDLHNKATQMMARLAQNLYVCVESSEDLFGKKVNIIEGKLKAILAKNGCSFTDNALQADRKITLTATTRETGNANGLVFCYADVEVDLYDNQKGKSVYNDVISQKGGSATADRAGRKAMEEAVQEIADKIMMWIK
ncbi:hypothetical protein FACS189456_0570 [Bacteroidia bacterium]|nr:hypothetical protein FACS189456_0570 [Bacteroidia bacterium]